MGNVIDPLDLIKEYGTDALRYFCLHEVSPFEDTPVTKELFKSSYNAGLANGLGNLVSRVLTMSEKNLESLSKFSDVKFDKEFEKSFDNYNLQEAGNFIWEKIKHLDEKIQKTEPFKIVKIDKEKAQKIIEELVIGLYEIAIYLEPLLPETSEKIRTLIKENKKPETPLFARKD